VTSLKTEISEVVTGLGMLHYQTPLSALSAQPSAIAGVDPPTWARLRKAYEEEREPLLFDAAWRNGRAFLQARDALRGRVPLRIEWKGASRPVGYEFLPADLRIDHVFLVSCKYRSRLLFNTSPAHLFDRALMSRGSRGLDWYLDVAQDRYQSLYVATREHLGDQSLPDRIDDLLPTGRAALKEALREHPWSEAVRAQYHEFSREVADRSAQRWRLQLKTKAQGEEQLWRLLRLASAPYYLLGASPHDSLRLRIATPWDWRQHFRLESFVVEADAKAEQPTVTWRGEVRRLDDGSQLVVEGFVEIRWSHGRFATPPEAKVQLVTAHELVPGYFKLN